MGFRFSKRITLLPGVRMNISKSGASLSVGPRGASVTMGKRGVYGNVGIPGSGLSYRERRSEEHTSELQSLMRISYAVFCLKKKKIDAQDETPISQKAYRYNED